MQLLIGHGQVPTIMPEASVYFIVSVFILCLLAGCSSKQEETDLLKGWVGNYAFFDDFQVPDGPYMMVDYKLTIYEEDGEYYADLYACGQTLYANIRAKVYGNDEWISLVFDKELEDNHLHLKDDTLLMSFRKDKADIYTYWAIFEPLTGNPYFGGVYFSKIDP